MIADTGFIILNTLTFTINTFRCKNWFISLSEPVPSVLHQNHMFQTTHSLIDILHLAYVRRRIYTYMFNSD